METKPSSIEILGKHVNIHPNGNIGTVHSSVILKAMEEYAAHPPVEEKLKGALPNVVTDGLKHLESGGWQRFTKPDDQDIIANIIAMAILVSQDDGKVSEDELTNIVATCKLIVDRLYENGNIKIASKQENIDNGTNT